MLGLVDRADEIVIGTTERVVKARAVHCMLAGQRGDAAYAKSIGCILWQPNPAEGAEGEPWCLAQTRIVSMVAVENRPAIPVMEPRGYKARRFYIGREVQLAKYDSPMTVKDAVWRRYALRRSRTAKDAVSASDK